MAGKNSEYWNEAYKKGVHWEDGHSKGAEEFSRMLEQDEIEAIDEKPRLHKHKIPVLVLKKIE